jgi:hypothetical protein
MSRVSSHDVISDLFVTSNHGLRDLICEPIDENEEEIYKKLNPEEYDTQNPMTEEDNAMFAGHEDDHDPHKKSRFASADSAGGRRSSLSRHSRVFSRHSVEHLAGKIEVPDMWSRDYIGLYSQYAAVGLIYGSTGTLLAFCVYAFDGASNVCSNAKNIVSFAWSFKIVYAIITDCYRPFGMRRKPWMLAGWTGVLIILFVLAFAADKMATSVWLISLMFLQIFLMLSDVPADGYSVELGQLEPPHQRGQILATGQRIRFTFCVLAGVIQMFLLNGPTTNDSGCPISTFQCWSWGLTINQYYGLLFAIIFILTVPVVFLKEIDASHIPQHTLFEFFEGIWATLQNLTTLYLVIFVIGVQSLSNFTNNAAIYLQYYVIKLTNFQAGVDTVTTYGALVTAIWIFQTYLINKNWRYTQYGSTILAAFLGLVWLSAFYNEGGTMNGWFTIFIDLDTYFVQGLTQVLFSMAVIELARPGQEATTYEFIITCANAAATINGIISTQMLTPLQAVGCNDDTNGCPSNTVDVTSKEAFNATNGPQRFTYYTLTLTAISLTSCFIFTRFLPNSKEECHEWKAKGDALGQSAIRGRISLALAVAVIGYGLIAAILLLDTETACQPAIGGAGC